MYFRLALISTFLVLIMPVYSQEISTTFFKSEQKNDRYDAGVPIFSPLILPAYTPEMEFYLIGGGLLSFKTKRNNDYLTHSLIPITAGINKNSGYYVKTDLYSYWLDDKLQFFINGYYQKRTDHYWGIGISNGKTINKSDSTTLYENESYKFNPSLSFKLIKHLYLGILADYNKTTATQLSDLMLEDQAVLKYGTDIKNTGLGIHICFDTRDISTDPEKGIFINIEEMFYSKTLSGDYNYKIFGLDYRQYLPLIRKGSLIAFQLNSKLGSGEIPWSDLQKLGTQNDLRGYFWGQYRDKSSLILQLEYRHTFSLNNSEELSRHGLVFWIGGGTVFPELNQINDLLISTGVGYRFEIQPCKNIRIDIGFGTENVGIYIGYNESF
jgi:hypothetical protein